MGVERLCHSERKRRIHAWSMLHSRHSVRRSFVSLRMTQIWELAKPCRGRDAFFLFLFFFFFFRLFLFFFFIFIFFFILFLLRQTVYGTVLGMFCFFACWARVWAMGKPLRRLAFGRSWSALGAAADGLVRLWFFLCFFKFIHGFFKKNCKK